LSFLDGFITFSTWRRSPQHLTSISTPGGGYASPISLQRGGTPSSTLFHLDLDARRRVHLSTLFHLDFIIRRRVVLSSTLVHLDIVAKRGQSFPSK
jgi:hypothetical protein